MPDIVFLFDDLIPILDAANIKLERLDIRETQASITALATASCLRGIKGLKFTMDMMSDRRYRSIDQAGFVFQTLTQSPLLSNVESFSLHRFGLYPLPPSQLITLLSSPMMSNDLITLGLRFYKHPISDVIKTLCTQHIDPNDETSPLKFGKLQKLTLSATLVTDDDLQLIFENLPQLTHLELCGLEGISPNALMPLLTSERAPISIPPQFGPSRSFIF